jgi:hypothetical protein
MARSVSRTGHREKPDGVVGRLFSIHDTATDHKLMGRPSLSGRSQEHMRAESRPSPSLVPEKTGGTMQNVMNRRWLLARYLEGMPTSDNWIMDKQPVPDPGAGQILVKAKWLQSVLGAPRSAVRAPTTRVVVLRG